MEKLAEGQIGQVIFRSLAKIAFNYLTYWAGPDFVLRKPFHPIRRYIRFAETATDPFVVIVEKAILGDEPIVGKRRLGHLLTLDRSKNKLSIVSQVSLLYLVTYAVLLAKDYNGDDFVYRRGSFFSIGDMSIHQVVPG